MSVFQWNSLQDLFAIQEKMNRLFEDTIHRTEFPDEGVDTALWSPAADVFENAEEIILQIEIPGVVLGDVRLESVDGKLRVDAHLRRYVLRRQRVPGEAAAGGLLDGSGSSGHFSSSMGLGHDLDRHRAAGAAPFPPVVQADAERDNGQQHHDRGGLVDEGGEDERHQYRAGGDDAIRPAFPASPADLAPFGWPTYRLHQDLIGMRRKIEDASFTHFMYLEDVDLCAAIRARGWEVDTTGADWTFHLRPGLADQSRARRRSRGR